MNRGNWHLSCSLNLLMESSFKNILCTRAEVRNHHLPFPGIILLNKAWRQGHRSAQLRRAVLFRVHKWLRFWFVFSSFIFLFVSSGVREVAVGLNLILLCFVWSHGILLLFMGSGDPPKGEWNGFGINLEIIMILSSPPPNTINITLD